MPAHSCTKSLLSASNWFCHLGRILSLFTHGCGISSYLKSSFMSFNKVALLLLLSHFNRVPLLATPWTAGYQAPPSMGFSRQEYWSAVPLPSPDFYRLIFCIQQQCFTPLFHITVSNSLSTEWLVFFCLIIVPRNDDSFAFSFLIPISPNFFSPQHWLGFKQKNQQRWRVVLTTDPLILFLT